MYNWKEVEKKWQKEWEDKKAFHVDLFDNRPKKFILPMMPYPSGEGLHVGHGKNYTIADAIARFYRLLGFNVLQCIGWDVHGLPAEQKAIETNQHPAVMTKKNIANFKKQLFSLGFSYDWAREIDTSDPEYYRWTQWIFCQMFKKGLVEYTSQQLYWCPELGTVLANEEVLKENGQRVSERGKYPVLKRTIWGWNLKMTNYSHQLLEGLNDLRWPPSIKNLQKNWIGKSEGVVVSFSLKGKDLQLSVFTVRPDIIPGVVALAVSPEHELLSFLTSTEEGEKVRRFCEETREKEDLSNRGLETMEGVFSGLFALNPLTEEETPVYVTNFVTADFATGVMGIASLFANEEDWKKDVSGSNDFFSRGEKEKNKNTDYAFAKKHQLLSKGVLEVVGDRLGYSRAKQFLGRAIFNRQEMINEVVATLGKKKLLRPQTFFHLQDFKCSRQRYWGTPLPIVHWENGQRTVLEEEELPLILPPLADFTPDKVHFSPLEKVSDWVKVEKNGLQGKRETSTLTQWADSCWYYAAFLLRQEKGYVDLPSDKGKAILKKWLPVDIYIGGAEHAVLHLLYARFWSIFLHEIGVFPAAEPFAQLICQGLILGADGEKMSKSLGNVINPDELVEEYGADAFRLYIAFLGPVDKSANFETEGVRAMRKWLNRVFVLFTKGDKLTWKTSGSPLWESYRRMRSAAQKFYSETKLNLVVSTLMVFINDCYASLTPIPIPFLLVFCQLLSPLAPHLSEELWHFWRDSFISLSELEELLEEKTVSQTTETKDIVVQINGRTKAIIKNPRGLESLEEAKKMISENPRLQRILENQEVVEVLMIKDNLVNIVVRVIDKNKLIYGN